jgi:serine/threonine protein kinase
MNLKQAKYINNERLINLFYGLCDGLNHIHDNNLAHRDLKPHNVLISNDGRIPILTDYGSITDRSIEIKTSKICQEIQDWAAQCFIKHLNYLVHELAFVLMNMLTTGL